MSENNEQIAEKRPTNTRGGDAFAADDAGPPERDDESRRTRPAEYGGRRNGLDPVRYGDWEKNGRCIDF